VLYRLRHHGRNSPDARLHGRRPLADQPSGKHVRTVD
jgi:hypothetical protein